MPKIKLLEKLDYYQLEEISINEEIFIFDAVKKIVKSYPLFWITVIGGIQVNKSTSFTNILSFYILNYYEEQNLILPFENLSNMGLKFDTIIKETQNNCVIIDNLLEFFNQNPIFQKDLVIAIAEKIKQNNENYNLTDFLEKYTNQYMLNLEAISIINFINKYEKKLKENERLFVISDGGLSKFRKFLNRTLLKKTNLLGLIKTVEINYLSEYGNNYLHSLPQGKRTAAFFIDYQNFRTLSFYFNIGKTVRTEIFSENLEDLLKIAGFIVSLSYLPSLYYRMPQNNILLAKLEKNLKNYITHEVLFTKFSQ
ncbi:MAG: hypothetical protein ACK4ZM_03810 [bacterium]